MVPNIRGIRTQKIEFILIFRNLSKFDEILIDNLKRGIRP